MKLFPMTCDRLHFWTPFVVGPAVFIPLFVLPQRFGPLLTGSVLALLGVCTLMAPRGVRVSFGQLEVTRLAWPSYRVPISELTAVERGPDTRTRGSVLRLAGVGGWFWSGGLFSAKDVGRVRAWLTRLGPTLVLHRRTGLPILLGVDDVEGLLKVLEGRGLRAR